MLYRRLPLLPRGPHARSCIPSQRPRLLASTQALHSPSYAARQRLLGKELAPECPSAPRTPPRPHMLSVSADRASEVEYGPNRTTIINIQEAREKIVQEGIVQGPLWQAVQEEDVSGGAPAPGPTHTRSDYHHILEARQLSALYKGGSIRFRPSPAMQAPHLATGFADSRPSTESLVQNSAEAAAGECSALKVFGAHGRLASGGSVINPGKVDSLAQDGAAGSRSEGPRHDNTYHDPSSSKSNNQRDNLPPRESATESLNQTMVPDQAMPDVEYPSCQEAGEESNQNSLVDSDAEDPEAQHTPMSFQIPPEALREAMSAPPESDGSFYSQALYRGPEDRLLTIHYCKTKDVAENVAPYFLNEKVLGFDIEWKPWAEESNIKANASLIQVASEDRVALFHIALFSGKTAEDLLPPTLRTIIESPDILKAGVAIKADFARLAKYLGVKPQGVYEVSRLYNLVEYYDSDPSKSGSKKLVKLATQVHQHLQLPLFKGEVRQSDWSKPLLREQIAYAATDAYASLRIYDALESKRKRLRPIPPRPDVCDYDSAPRPRAKPVRKPVKARESKEEAADTAEPQVAEEEQAAEEDSEYETAAEELVDVQELERSSDSESSSSSASAGLQEDPDAEYVPTDDRTGRVDLQKKSQERTTRQSRRIGRLNLTSLTKSDVAYPTLPVVSDDSGSDSEAAFEHISKSRPDGLTRPSPAKDVAMIDRDNVMDMQSSLESLHLGTAEAPKDMTKRQASEEHPESSTRLSKGTKMPSSKFATPSQEQKAIVPADPRPPPPQPPTTLSSASTTTTAATTPTPTKSPEYLAATNWAQSHLLATIPSPDPNAQTPSRIRATLPHLRAYHLWHHQHLSLSSIAAHLRDPPLAESTVCGYVLQAITLEKLEYRRQDVKGVLRGLPVGVRMGRWRGFVERVGGVGE